MASRKKREWDSIQDLTKYVTDEINWVERKSNGDIWVCHRNPDGQVVHDFAVSCVICSKVRRSLLEQSEAPDGSRCDKHAIMGVLPVL